MLLRPVLGFSQCEFENLALTLKQRSDIIISLRQKNMINDKQFYTDLKAACAAFKESDWVRVVHLFDKDNSYGGITIAYRPVLHDSKGYPAGKFGDVAVAWCSPQDRYNRKLGEALALQRMQFGNCITLPIYVDKTPVRFLKDMFQPMLRQLVGF